MSLLTGTLAPFRFLSLGLWPGEADAARSLQSEPFRPFHTGSEDTSHGWCDWRNPLLEVDADSLCADGIATFGLRIEKRKVPASLINAHLDLRLKALMAEKDLAFVGKEARISMRDEVVAELLPKVLPSMKVILVQWNYKAGLVVTDGNSDVLQGLFVKTFGVELQQICPLILAGRVCPSMSPEALMQLDPISLVLDEVTA